VSAIWTISSAKVVACASRARVLVAKLLGKLYPAAASAALMASPLEWAR
jgi:hypothetical protein